MTEAFEFVSLEAARAERERLALDLAAAEIAFTQARVRWLSLSRQYNEAVKTERALARAGGP